MSAAVQAFKLAKGFFLIPAMMAFSGLIWTDDVTAVGYLSALLATSALILAFAAAIEGQFASRLTSSLACSAVAIGAQRDRFARRLSLVGWPSHSGLAGAQPLAAAFFASQRSSWLANCCRSAWLNAAGPPVSTPLLRRVSIKSRIFNRARILASV